MKQTLATQIARLAADCWATFRWGVRRCPDDQQAPLHSLERRSTAGLHARRLVKVLRGTLRQPRDRQAAARAFRRRLRANLRQ